MEKIQSPTSSRKDEHLEICTQKDVESVFKNSWDLKKVKHCALPEINFNDVVIEKEFIDGRNLFPVLISSMTGGSLKSEAINRSLAQAAEKFNCPMGVGSQRVALENRDRQFFQLRKIAPKATLLANIGLVQFNVGVRVDDIQFILDALEADALILHCNVLQELLQNEGDHNFKGLFLYLEKIRKAYPKIPIILKETGCGIDLKTAQRALDSGVDALDIAGLGGSHWGYIEGLRSNGNSELSNLFRNWGLGSQEQLIALRAKFPNQFIIASGGIRSPLDILSAYSYGASFCAMALPFIQKLSQGEKALFDYFDFIKKALKVGLMASGHQKIGNLQNDQ